jgi:hypothetical protein
MDEGALAKLRVLALVAAGVGVGALASVGFGHRKAASAAQNPTPELVRPPTPKNQHKMSDIEARLRQLELQAKSQPATSVPAPVASEEPVEAEADVAPEVKRDVFWQKVRTSIDTHNAEPVDPTWATKTNGFLRSDLSRLATQNHFRVSSIDCRTTTCLAKVEWATEQEAVEEHSRLMHSPYQANCTRSVVLEEDALPSGARQALLFFECESWRVAGESVFQEQVRN